MKIINQDGIRKQFFSLPSDWEKNIGTGLDYTSIASAISALERKFVAYPKLTLDAGTYAEKILDGSEKLLCRQLEFVGDTRAIVGGTYIDGGTIRNNNTTNGGSGTCGLGVSATYNLNVSGTTTNPNFPSAGVITNDEILVMDNSNAIAKYTVSSASGVSLTLTTAAPTIGNSGTAMVILPNRKISLSTSLLSGDFPCKLKFTGFVFECDSAEPIFNLLRNKQIELNNCIFYHNGQNRESLYMQNDCHIYSSNSNYCNVSFWDSANYNIVLNGMCTAYLVGFTAIKTTGICALYGGVANLPYSLHSSGGLTSINRILQSRGIFIDSWIYGYYRGLKAYSGGNISAAETSLSNCNIALYASLQSFVDATATILTSNTTNASPTFNNVGNQNSFVLRP